ncbi:hypothetical protein EDD18DRAFT_1106970 [Armillaria luteobubalina]|uniref:Uncharacterized protein n=1 Tax=Armillaria luteobubalina TaxID=153913 RepID=A0AA39Q1J2_9AGAR|nr:hypothetical protein EDD18DRAFT_1106970 [Armillaria luteobubalina]
MAREKIALYTSVSNYVGKDSPHHTRTLPHPCPGPLRDPIRLSLPPVITSTAPDNENPLVPSETTRNLHQSRAISFVRTTFWEGEGRIGRYRYFEMEQRVSERDSGPSRPAPAPTHRAPSASVVSAGTNTILSITARGQGHKH